MSAMSVVAPQKTQFSTDHRYKYVFGFGCDDINA